MDEIREAVLETATNEDRVERFLARRRRDLGEDVAIADGFPRLVAWVLPAYFRGEAILDTSDEALCRLVFTMTSDLLRDQRVFHDYPMPCLEGVCAVGRDGTVVEVHRTGYMELQRPLRPRQNGRAILRSRLEANYLNGFLRLVSEVCARYLSGEPMLVGLYVHLPRGMGFAYSQDVRSWPRSTLEIPRRIEEDLATDHGPALQYLCHRLWQAFGFERAPIFDSDGNLIVAGY